MKVLVLDSDGEGGGRRATAALAAAGHEVHRCHEEGAPAFPCNGLAGTAPCPLDGVVDVAVVVREHPWPRPTALEDGVTCALRHAVPLVVSGRTALDPFEGFATEAVDGTDGLVDACERALAAPLPRHGAAAVETATEVLVKHDLPTKGVAAEVHRRDGRLHVALDVPAAAPVDAGLAGMLATRVAGRLRQLDRYAAAIDVVVNGASV
jgi:hypothetical protein